MLRQGRLSRELLELKRKRHSTHWFHGSSLKSSTLVGHKCTIMNVALLAKVLCFLTERVQVILHAVARGLHKERSCLWIVFIQWLGLPQSGCTCVVTFHEPESWQSSQWNFFLYFLSGSSKAICKSCNVLQIVPTVSARHSISRLLQAVPKVQKAWNKSQRSGSSYLSLFQFSQNVWFSSNSAKSPLRVVAILSPVLPARALPARCFLGQMMASL